MRPIFLGISIVVLAIMAGCSAEGPSIVGTWKVQPPTQPATLVASKDHTFTLQGLTKADSVYGRWETEGNTVRFFRDIRDGGDAPFGMGGDGSSDYTLSADHMSMKSTSTTGMIMKKQS